MAEGTPRHHDSAFTECTDEFLEAPERVHLDPFGNTFVCQGLIIGNLREKPLRTIMEDYRPREHPIVGPLIRGGPAGPAQAYGHPA